MKSMQLVQLAAISRLNTRFKLGNATLALAFSFVMATPEFSFASTDLPETSGIEVIDLVVPATENQTSELDLEIHVGRQRYRFEAPDEEALEPFRKLNDRQQAFLQRRRTILSSAARALQLMRYGIGIGSVAGEKISYITEKIRKRPISPRESRTLKERSQAIIENMLRALERKLWSSARVIADYNEVHFFIAPTTFAFGGGRVQTANGEEMRGWGGGYNLGFSIGFNRQKKAAVFEIVREVEVFKDSILPKVFMAGGAINFGIALRVRDEEGLGAIANRFKPPALPFTTTDGEKVLMISSGPAATIPPLFLADAISSSNGMTSETAFRVLISPVMKGWIRVESSLPKIVQEDLRLTVDNTGKLIGLVQTLASRYRGKNACRALFN